MEFVNVPITDFLRHSLSAAGKRGFMWVITLLAREADIEGLYSNLRKAWNSIDSITGKYFLFVFAGKENNTHNDRWNSRVCDSDVGYFSEYNDFVQIINPNVDLSNYYLQYEYRKNKQRSMDNLEKNQTSAVNSLRDYFSINERDIPCLVFTRVRSFGYIKEDTYIIPICGNDVYAYFKQLFNSLDPILKQINDLAIRLEEVAAREKHLNDIIKSDLLDLDGRILALRKELLIYAKKNIVDDTGRTLLECINNFTYGRFNQPLRSILNRYIDLSKNYEKKTGNRFDESAVDAKISQRSAIIARSKAELSTSQLEQAKLKQLLSDLVSRIEEIIRGSKMDKEKQNDNRVTISVTGGIAQINTAFDNAEIKANQHIGYNEMELANLISAVRDAIPTDISNNEIEAINESVDVIEDEVKSAKPRKGFIKTALTGLKAIKGTAEFSAAVAALIQFVQTLL